MKVQTAGGAVIELGTTETTPTIGITDYSRRVTDDFGVTTVVKRGFARRMSVRLALPFDSVDAVQGDLADLRATPAIWIADDRFEWLKVEGFFKDFEVDLAVPPMSFCRLTVEGLAETEDVADPGGNPAPPGQASTLRLLHPADGVPLTASSVPEADYPEWVAGTTYAYRAHVIKEATHRIYESVTDGNVGHDPATAFDQWIDLGPTNRWAMFDQALGTATSANASIVVTMPAATAVALLDVVASTVRVQATGYDQTKDASSGAVTFLDLPAISGAITVTIAGTGTVSVGTLVAGSIALLGVTEAAPTAGITDYSRKVVDDFGEVTVVERAWAKRMTAKALIRTEEIDHVANRIAAVRARPCLWIGQDGLGALTIYGFFKDFSIEVGESVSKLSLNIEGLSKAPPLAIVEADASIDWLGEWVAIRTYGQSDIVTHGGRRFWSLVAGNINHEPPATGPGNAWWSLFSPLTSVTELPDAGSLATADTVDWNSQVTDALPMTRFGSAVLEVRGHSVQKLTGDGTFNGGVIGAGYAGHAFIEARFTGLVPGAKYADIALDLNGVVAFYSASAFLMEGGTDVILMESGDGPIELEGA